MLLGVKWMELSVGGASILKGTISSQSEQTGYGICVIFFDELGDIK